MGFTRLEARLVGAAALLVFSRVFGMSVVLPGFRPFADTLTTSATLAGVALGAYGLTLALMQLPMGLASDRWGRRPILILGSLLFVAGSIGAALAPSIGILIAARLVQGLGAVSSAAMAMVGESVPAERRTTAMALVGIPAGAGFMLGMIAGPMLEPAVTFRGLFWIVAAVGLAATVPALGIRPAPPSEDLGHIGRPTRAIAALSVAGFAGNFALLSVMFFIAEADRSLLVPMLVVALLVMGGLSRVVDKRQWSWQPAVVGLPLLGLGAAAYVLVPGWLAVLGGTVFFSAHATLSAVLPSQVSRLAGAAGGRGHGVQNIVAYPGSFLGPLTAGAFVDAGMPGGAFVVLGAVVVVAALAVGWGVGRSQHARSN